MAWSKASKGAVVGTGEGQNSYQVLTETVTLGGTATTRYSSVFSVPPGLGFTVVSNTAATNTSGSLSDHLYVSWDNSSFYLYKTLRDCNYADDTNQGTSFKTLDTLRRMRYVDPNYVGSFPYYKVGITHAAAESTGKTIGLAIVIGNRDKGSFTAKFAT